MSNLVKTTFQNNGLERLKKENERIQLQRKEKAKKDAEFKKQRKIQDDKLNKEIVKRKKIEAELKDKKDAELKAELDSLHFECLREIVEDIEREDSIVSYIK